MNLFREDALLRCPKCSTDMFDVKNKNAYHAATLKKPLNLESIMKKTAALLIFMLFAFTAAICTNPANGYGLGGSKMPQATLDTKVRISFGSDEVIVVLFDNPASKD